MSKKIAIMQPTYLPWTGYIALAMSVDQFVYLDSVQFTRRSWQQRNRIKTAHGEMLLTVPVVKGPREQKINDVCIHTSSDFPTNHIDSIIHAYSKAEYFNEYSGRFINILKEGHTNLTDLNIKIVDCIFDVLDIKIETLRSSSLNLNGKKDELLANICNELEADHYVSPIGSSNYLDDSSFFGAQGISYSYLSYSPVEYEQLFVDFIPYLSTIDLIFNVGKDSKKIIEKGLNYE